MNKDPLEILRQWMYCVNERDLETLLGLYASDAVLIPTFSNRILASTDALRDYFTRLCEREGLEIQLRDDTLRMQSPAADIHTASGLYLWRFVVDGQLLNFEARFTYVFNTSAPRPIAHHHSSQVPRML